MFIGRKSELKDISEKLNSNKSEFLLIYGRRRIGKTYLINQAIRNTKDSLVFSYTFRDVPSEINIKELGEYVSSFFHEEEFFSFKNLGSILSYLFTKAKKERLIVFLDEYSFLRREDSGIDSYFQKAIDQYKDESQMKLIICGSYLGVMESLIEHNSPLYGRFSYILKLSPFNYYESSLFAPGLTDDVKFRFYAYFGGSGFSLANLDYSLTPEENLEKLFISPDSLFEREVLSTSSQEISKIENARFLFELIASGIHKYSDLNDRLSSLKLTNNISYLLKKLIDMDLIKKEIPINKNSEKCSSYYLKDNLMDFYYSILFKKVSSRSLMSSAQFLKSITDQIEKEYLPRKFEDVSREFLTRLSRQGKINPPLQAIGRYVYNNKEDKTKREFDVTVLINDSWSEYECKYLKDPVSLKEYQDESDQVKKLGLKFKDIGFISKSGYTKDFPTDVPHYSLSDFYKD